MARKHSVKKGNVAKSKPRPLHRKDGSMKRWQTAADIPLDEEEQFHANRDRILLDGEDVHSDDEGDEEEVFALKGMPPNSDEESSEDDGEEQEDEDASPRKLAKEKQPKSPSTKGKQKKGKGAPPSDESSSSEEEEEEGWGHKKSAYYASNADELASDDEEANELEEQEARRLQAKAREAMTDEDFGLGDLADMKAVEAAGDLDEPVSAVQLQPLPQDKLSLLRHLQRTNPEALALAGDWDSTARMLMKTQQQVEEPSTEEDGEDDVINSGMLHLYHQSLLQYTATLAFYLYLRASNKYAQHPELLSSHPIMSRLLTLKRSIATLEDLGVGEEDDDSDVSELSSGDEELLRMYRRDTQVDDLELRSLWQDMFRLQGTMSSLPSMIGSEAGTSMRVRPSHIPGKPSTLTFVKETAEPPKKKRKTAQADEKQPKVKAKASKTPVFDLEEPEFPTKTKARSGPSASTDADAFGEFTALQSADALDKAARKRSLRFHTSKIESASARRDRARANAGGDDDIPWRNRKKEQEERQKRAVQKSREHAGEDLDDAEPEPRAKKRTRDDTESASDGEEQGGYYDLVKRKAKEKKEKKTAEYEAVQAAAREDILVDDPADGPRSVSRAILKNKGLTPSRSKSVRNPRVKKRQRYETAKKKVSSQKAIFKGGLAATRGKYEGEKSGISKVIKGVRLS